MSRIIFVPQYPTPMRYQEWWWTEFPKEFKKAGFDVHVLGENAAKYIEEANKDMFSPIQSAIDLETAQIKEYMALDLKHDDILFMADISFPGLFGNVLFHKKPCKSFGFCHATSRNELDYFAKHGHAKFAAETATANALDVVFVGSQYHFMKLCWSNVEVTYLPYPPLKTFNEKKTLFMVSASRPTPQKVNLDLEIKLETEFKWPIVRRDSLNWEDYYKFLSQAKVLLITAQEETFGYQVVDAVLNHCIPIAPNRCSYPELLPPECLYDSEEDLIEKLKYLLTLEVMPPTPELLCDGKMKDFYRNIIEIMTKEKEYPF